MANDIRNVSAQCQVIHFPWAIQNFTNTTSDADLARADLVDISLSIVQATFSKQLGDPAGEFSISLANDQDWVANILPGTWLLIYLSNDGDLFIPKKEYSAITPRLLANQKNRLRCIGYVERVAKRGSVNSDGAVQISYSVTGKDFGCIYSQTNIWHNTILFEKALLDAATNQLNVSTTRKVHNLVETLHRLMFSPADIIKTKAGTNKSLTVASLQWILPAPMLTALGLTFRRGVPFYGNINNLFSFEPTSCNYPIENPMSALNGVAWDQLKTYSIEVLHELFVETDDFGHPKIIFRPIPWRLRNNAKTDRVFINSTKGLFKNLPRVVLDLVNLIEFDFGADNHSRYNVFYLVPNSTKQTAESGVQALLDQDQVSGFPRMKQASIKRHGLRLFFQEVNALIHVGVEKVDKGLVQAYNEVILDYWDNAEYYESGSATIIGDNRIKLGKVLELPEESPSNGSKLFYIEGYEDTFIVNPNAANSWTQELSLTRGIEKSVLDTKFLNEPKEPNNYVGDFTRTWLN